MPVDCNDVTESKYSYLHLNSNCFTQQIQNLNQNDNLSFGYKHFYVDKQSLDCKEIFNKKCKEFLKLLQ